MDLDPFEPLGIAAPTMRFLDVFLLHCLLSESPPDTPQEIAELGRNQHRVAARGREPGLVLEQAGRERPLTDWGLELLAGCVPLAEALDAAHGGDAHGRAVAAARASLLAPETLPSARVLRAVEQDFAGSFTGFVEARSQQVRAQLLALPFDTATRERFEAESAASVEEQRQIEAADTMPFDIYREQYLRPDRLGLKGMGATLPAAELQAASP